MTATVVVLQPSPARAGGFSRDPSELTCDARGLSFCQMYQGGEQFEIFLNDWWTNTFLPALQKMTQEISTTQVDQSRNAGSFIDAQLQGIAQRRIQVREAEAVKKYQPSELSCVAASATPALASTGTISKAISRGYRMDQTKILSNAVGSTTQHGAAQDFNARWQQYTNTFCDPTANKGAAGCTVAGPVPDGDIGVETLLFKETINIGDPNVLAATTALLRNLAQPRATNTVPPDIINTAQGQEMILKRKHLTTLRTLATGIISDIISRRAAIPLGTLTPAGAQSPAAGTQVQAIRAAAGVPAADISTNPSYNEIMLAMTKERFLDPKYYVHLGEGEGAIEQEQASLDAYTSLMLQDIYEVQEQINALMAARASMKFNADFMDKNQEHAPVQ